MRANDLSQPTKAMLDGDVPRVVCPSIIVDGVSVIESTLASSEAYLLPEQWNIQTQLSGWSASSSVHVETGAPDIRHLSTLSSNTDAEAQPRLIDGSVSSAYLASDDDCPHLMSSFKSSLEHDSSCCEIILIPVEDEEPRKQYLRLPEKNDARCDRSRWKDKPVVPMSVKMIECTQDGTVEAFEVASSVTLSDSLTNIYPSMFDFSGRLMPETAPQRRHSSVRGQHNLIAVGPASSRYRRPIDSLLIVGQKPSPIPMHSVLKQRCPISPTAPNPQNKPFQKQRSNSSFSHDISGENVDPQSLLARRNEKKAVVLPYEAVTPTNVLKTRYQSYHSSCNVTVLV